MSKVQMPKIYGEEDPQGKFSPQLRFQVLGNNKWYMGFVGIPGVCDDIDNRCVQFLHTDGTISVGVPKMNVFSEKDAIKEWNRRKTNKIQELKDKIAAIEKEKWSPHREGW